MLVMSQLIVEEVLKDLPRTAETKRQVLEWLYSAEVDFPALERRNPSAIDLEGEIDSTLDWNVPKRLLGPMLLLLLQEHGKAGLLKHTKKGIGVPGSPAELQRPIHYSSTTQDALTEEDGNRDA